MSLKVLLIDDHMLFREGLISLLQRRNIEVLAAVGDGNEGIRLAQEMQPDIILLDIEMPRMDGYELLNHIRADARLRHVPIVMITSRAGQKHRQKARKAGANAYLTKPYQEVELVEQVSAMLDIELTPRRSD